MPKMPAPATSKRRKNGHDARPPIVPLTLDGLDRRSRAFRRYEAIRAAIVADAGGVDLVSEAEAQIADKAAFIAMQLETMQALSLAGEEIDLTLYGGLTDRLRRLLESIGLKRVPRDVTPSLSTYLQMPPEERAKVARP